MTTPPNGTSTEEPPTTGPRVPRDQMRDLGRLRRSTTDRHVAGVAGGIARHLDIDPLLVRVVFVVMVFFGGGGLLLYAACWLLVPEDTDDRAVIPLDDRTRNVALWIATALAALSAVGDSVGGWHFPWPLPIAALILLVLLSRRRQHWTAPPLPRDASAAAPGSSTPPPAPTAPQYAGYRPPIQRDPRRRGPILFGFTVALAALGIGVLITARLAGADIPPSAYPATVAATCGVMLLVSAWFGRGGGLILVGLVATVAMVVASTAGDWTAGRVTERPTTAAALDSNYRIGAGELRVDLTDVGDTAALDGRTLDLDGRFGHIVVLVPEDGLDVDVHTTIDAAGESFLFGDRHDGSSDAHHDGGADAPQLTIDAELVFGQIEVRTEDAR